MKKRNVAREIQVDQVIGRNARFPLTKRKILTLRGSPTDARGAGN
jgi:hypothetical protein